MAQALTGFIVGYVLLHPVSMIIFRFLDVAQGHSMSHAGSVFPLGPILHSFSIEMVPMGILFGLVGAFISSVYGYQSATIARQRDTLAKQLELNQKYRKAILQQAAILKGQNERLAELDRANRRTTLFMVHDFKTHLATIRGFTEFLMERRSDSSDPEGTSALDRIWRQAQRMLAAVNDLLDFARLERAPEIQRERVDLAEMFQKTMADFSAPIYGNRIRLGDAHRTCPMLTTDPRLLGRVIGNLVFNAIHHGKAGTPVLLDARLMQDSDAVLFSCRNEGGHIVSDSLATLVQEFKTGTGGYSGSAGLGLAFCKEAVDALSGRIWFEHVENHETTFYFTVPFSEGGSK